MPDCVATNPLPLAEPSTPHVISFNMTEEYLSPVSSEKKVCWDSRFVYLPLVLS